MKIGKHDLALSHQGQLAGLGLLDFDDHVGLAKDLFWSGGHVGPVPEVLVIRKTGPQPGPSLDEHFMPGPSQFLGPHRQQPDPVLVTLDFGWYSDDHWTSPGLFAARVYIGHYRIEHATAK